MERVNAPGIAQSQRYMGNSKGGKVDLNRAFPDSVDKAPEGRLSMSWFVMRDDNVTLLHREIGNIYLGTNRRCQARGVF